MTDRVAFVALDLGAESGRVVLGRFDGDRVALTDLHRFPHRPVQLIDGLHWDILWIMQGITEGLAKAAGATSGQLASVGVDSWAVDFGLLDRGGTLLSNPYAYRDARTDRMLERAVARVPRTEIYRTTGIQFLQFNTLYQLLAMEGSPLLEIAETLLLIPDLINYWLTGERACEYTNATTTQLYDLAGRDWAWDLLERLHIPLRIFPRIVPPGTSLGPLLPSIALETGLGPAVSVTAVASHDTASAVVAVPAQQDEFAYISSGTWSLVGLETACPIVTDAAMDANFTNEGGFAGTTRLLRNVMGLWLLQECRRTWNQREGRSYSYDDLVRLAQAAPAFGPLIDPDDARFLPPGDMPERIQAFCLETGQRPPESPSEVVRCILESLALTYRWVLERAEALSGRRVATIHVVGGGVRNALLCQLTASAAGRPVLAGPVEATALGNIMVQIHARGYVRSPVDIRAVVRRSIGVQAYEPEGSRDRWDAAYERLRTLMRTHRQVPAAAEREGG